MEDVWIADEALLAHKLAVCRHAGRARLRVVSDWDRTLTRARTPDGRDTTSYLAVVHGGYLGADYRAEMARLYARYRKVELDGNMPVAEKSHQMHEWWASAFALLCRFGLTLSMIEEIAGRDLMVLRDGAEAFFQALSEHWVLLDILSAGIGDLIDGFLAQRELLTPNVCVTANRLTFDGGGGVTGFEEPVIHSLNKCADGAVAGKGCCVLLLGDTLEDARMISGGDCEAVIRVGFLNVDTEKDRVAYLEAYDAVIGGDGSLAYVNALLEDILALRVR